MTTGTIHTCSYYCERPECVRRQRDELRDRMESALARQPAAARGDVRIIARDIHYAIMDDGLAPLSNADNHKVREAILRVLEQALAAEGVQAGEVPADAEVRARELFADALEEEGLFTASERIAYNDPPTAVERAALRAIVAALAQQPAAFNTAAAPVHTQGSVEQQPASVGEEIMVNAAHDVYMLPLQPSGLSSGPRFVVHVPAPEQQPAAPSGEAVEKWGQSYRCGCFLGFPTKASIPGHCPQHLRDKNGTALPLAAEPQQPADAEVREAAPLRYFAYDSDNGDYNEYATLAEAVASAQESLDYAGDDGWPDGGPTIVYGAVLGEAREVAGSRRPAGPGDPPDFDFIVEYELTPAPCALTTQHQEPKS